MIANWMDISTKTLWRTPSLAEFWFCIIGYFYRFCKEECLRLHRHIWAGWAIKLSVIIHLSLSRRWPRIEIQGWHKKSVETDSFAPNRVPSRLQPTFCSSLEIHFQGLYYIIWFEPFWMPQSRPEAVLDSVDRNLSFRAQRGIFYSQPGSSLSVEDFSSFRLEMTMTDPLQSTET